jgi:Sugar phosphate isomerases/epimerases
MEDLRKADGRKIFMVHINAAADKPVGTFDSDAYRLMPGDGIIPTGEIFNALKEIGYQGIIIILTKPY